jgi:GNAT superfamily N-acetyltransferase
MDDGVSDVLAAHRARLRALDSVLAEAKALPAPIDGDVPLACPGGRAVVRTTIVDLASFDACFTAARESRLVARVDGPKAMAELLDRWERLDGVRPGPDSTAVLTWPSRDTAMTRTLLKHGFAPQTVLAVRRSSVPAPAGSASAVVVRRLAAADLDAAAALWMQEDRWDEQFGSMAVRASTQGHIQRELESALDPEGLWCWVAERDGAIVGLVAVQPPQRAAWAVSASSFSSGVYVTCGVVAEGSRGGGIGSALMRDVYASVDTAGIPVSLLHYAALNPLSGPFWSRCGYRPLTTVWARGLVG